MINPVLQLIWDGVRTATGLGTVTTRSQQILDRARIPEYQLECDGHRPFWLMPGTDYSLTYDGDHWQVTGGEWGQARLTRAGTPISDLPTGRGPIAMVPGETYLLVGLPRDRWELLWVHP